MAVYIGPTFRCPPGVADLLGMREGETVAHMTADGQRELRMFAAQLELPDKRLMGGGGPRWRYIITLGERMQARAHGAQEVTVADLGRIESSRRSAVARR